MGAVATLDAALLEVIAKPHARTRDCRPASFRLRAKTRPLPTLAEFLEAPFDITTITTTPKRRAIDPSPTATSLNPVNCDSDHLPMILP